MTCRRCTIIANIIFALSCSYENTAFSQTVRYSQFWNELAFTRPLKGKFSIEINLGQTWTSTPDQKSLLSQNAQVYARGWGHYYLDARWKFSLFYAFYYNKYVPEIDQREYPESRLALQATWYIIRHRLTLLSRMRVEDRHIRDAEGVFEGVYRFRDQVKLIYPIKEKRIRAGVFYGLGSGELFFKTPSEVTGKQFFDRTRLTMGGGYSITDDIQVELTYVNEFLPRTAANEVYHALQLNFSFNNLLPDIVGAFKAN